jgi:THO complex subunit 2
MIPMIVGSMNYCTDLTLDITIFLSLRAISEMSRSILKENEGIIESWYANIANFIGQILRKHFKIDLAGIFVFICLKLSSDEDMDILNILLLNEVLSKMSGYETITDLTDHQLQSLTGGIGLKTEAFGFSDSIRR